MDAGRRSDTPVTADAARARAWWRERREPAAAPAGAGCNQVSRRVRPVVPSPSGGAGGPRAGGGRGHPSEGAAGPPAGGGRGPERPGTLVTPAGAGPWAARRLGRPAAALLGTLLVL